MNNTACHTTRCSRRGLPQLVVCIASLLAAGACAASASAASPSDEQPQREIFVPFDDLHVILSSDVQRVFVTREEYEALAAKAKQATRPEQAEQPAAVLSADYAATIEENRARLMGTLVVAAPSDALSAVELELSGVALRSATLDGKPAALGRNPAGTPILFVSSAGRHELKLEILAPLDTAAAQRTLSFQIPTPPATRLRLTVPGNVEIRDGATIIRRDVDQRPATIFDLLPRRGRNSLVLSLNNHQLRAEGVVVAHAVQIGEITSAYERLHVTETLSVLHGAAEQFRFALPEGFEVTSVSGPQVGRWAITTENAQRVLDVALREPITDSATLNIVAIHTPVALADWRLPKFRALDVAGEAAVVGLLLESRLKPADLQPTNLIAIDTGVLAQALPISSLESQAGAPAMVPVAAFYAPGGDYQLTARFAPPPSELRVTTNVLLTFTQSQLEARGGFALLNVTDKLLEFDFSIPAGWQVTELSLAGGITLTPETYPTAAGGTRIHVRLPQAVPWGQSQNVYFRAVHTPGGWLDEWSAKRVEFPVFQVSGATRDGGAIAVHSEDDMLARAKRVTRLTPLDANDKSNYGLEKVATELAYRYDEPPYSLTLAVARVQPRLTARAFSFFRVEPELLTAHYEIAYDVTEARASRLVFALPASTPAELAIHGLDNVAIKESTSAIEGQDRKWTVLLGQQRRGAVRLAIDFQQPLGKEAAAIKEKNGAVQPPAEVTMPLVRALNVAYQTGMVAVEGNSQSDVQVQTTLRKVDVGLLAEADYQTGRRLLGAFGYGGDEAKVNVTIARPPGYDLPTAIVERAELLTMISASGRSQTVARFQLRCKSQLVEVQLPGGSTLWSAYLDGQPTQPQREGGSLLVALPATAAARRSNLQLVYETPINALGLAGDLELAAPKLLLRATREAAGDEVPLADLVWQLSTPDGLKVVRSNGTVYSGDIVARESPLARVAAAVSDVFPTANSAKEAARFEPISSTDNSMSMSAPRNIAAAPSSGAIASGPHADFQQGSFGAKSQVLARPTAQKPADLAPPADSKPAALPDAGDKEAATEAIPQSAPDKSQPQLDYRALAGRESAKNRQSLWALEGVRSLPIEFQPDQIQTTFQSLGAEPRLSVTLVDRQRIDLLGWCVGLLVFWRGLMLTKQPGWRQFRFVATVLAISLALPLALPWTGLISPLCNMAFYAACWLAVYYLAAAVVRRVARFVRRANKPTGGAKTAAVALGLLMLLGRIVPAEDSPTPVTVPPDAIIVPYDPATQNPLQALETLPANAKPGGEKHAGSALGADKSQKLLVPYKKYLELQRAAQPGAVVTPAPPADYALAGGQFSARLNGGESLLIEGNFDVDVLVDHAVSIPLAIGGGVLTKVEVDGKQGVVAAPPDVEGPRPADGTTPAATPPPVAAPLALIISGAGHRQVALAMRFPLQQRGGWQIAEGRLPALPAAAVALEVAKAATEVTFSGGVDRGSFETQRDNETLATALSADGAFRVQWRAKTGSAPVDQSLAARDSAQFDVQEAGLRLVWRFELEFRRSQRDSFTVDVPDGYLVEQVTGGNVRGWNLKEAGGLRKLEVTLLKAAQDAESFSVALSRRGTVAGAASSELTVPVLNLEGAAQQAGELTIRASPLLELRTESVSGASRVDGESAPAGTSAGGDDSPLGIVPFQVYRFATTPFTIKLSVRPVAPHVSAEVQSVLRISERQRSLESRLRLRVDQRPIYRLRIALPEDLRLDRVSAPEPFQWAVGQDGPRRLLSLYFAAGQRQPFDIVLAGMLGKYGAAATVAAPNLEIVDADEQSGSIEQTGDIAIEADPALEVRAEKLVHCEMEPIDRVNVWLTPAQQQLARLALRYRTPDYAAQLQLSPRKPLVHCDTFTNVRVNQRTVEETILFDFTIREAGIRSLSFVLPQSLRDARISAPLLRQKTVEPLAGGAAPSVRVRIELQEEVMGSLRVLVESDQLLSSGKFAAPVPQVETGQTDHRYVTLESAGRDEVVVDEREGVDSISSEQSEWRMLTALLGRGLTQAYLVRPDAAQPRLTLHAQDRAAVETASARIGLAKALLVVDANGAYRGAQLYRVDNSLEQFLEIQLPAGARLWTAHVAGEPVKPAAGKPASAAASGAAGDLVRIPLIKTASGDADYAVLLKYGGQLGRLGAVDHVEFPLIHTINIHVELSQVELYVPESYDWFNFGGTMRQVYSAGDLTAGRLAYNTKQIGLAAQALHSEDPFARTRALNNLKILQGESEELRRSAEDYRGNDDVAVQLQANSSIQNQLDADVNVNAPVDLGRSADELENRVRLNRLYQSQSNTRAGDVVNSSGANFGPRKAQAQATPPGKDSGQGQALSLGFQQRELSTAKSIEGRADSPSSIPAMSGQPAAPSLTVAKPNGDTAALGTTTDGVNSTDKAEFQESGGGRAAQSIRRYAGRLAQQNEQSTQRDFSLNGGGQLAGAPAGKSGAGTYQDMQRGRGPVDASTFSDRDQVTGGGQASILSGNNTYAGGTTVGGAGTLRATSAPAGNSQSVKPVAPAILASLEVDLRPRGTKYLFTTPRGEAEITARAVSTSLVGRLERLAELAVVIMVLWMLLAAVRRWRSSHPSPNPHRGEMSGSTKVAPQPLQ